MRGKGYVWRLKGTFSRITPAYAGKSHLYGIITVEVRDHPRLCGEKPVDHGDSVHSRGSPPPMRGKVDPEFAESVTFRITPAYAGKSEEAMK